MEAPRFDHYDWAGGREAMLRFGPADGPVVVAAAPLFEEANRTRALLVATLRALARHGIGSALPDLPGQGESLVPTEAMTLEGLRAAYAAAAARVGGRHGVAFRSGALIDTAAPLRSRWHLAPVTGPALLAELKRIRQASGDTGTREAGEPVLVAGNLVAPALLHDLGEAMVPSGARTVRLDGDPRPADVTIAGPPLWRRSEPANDPALAQRLADDIADWIARCAG